MVKGEEQEAAMSRLVAVCSLRLNSGSLESLILWSEDLVLELHFSIDLTLKIDYHYTPT